MKSVTDPKVLYGQTSLGSRTQLLYWHEGVQKQCCRSGMFPVQTMMEYVERNRKLCGPIEIAARHAGSSVTGLIPV